MVEEEENEEINILQKRVGKLRKTLHNLTIPGPWSKALNAENFKQQLIIIRNLELHRNGVKDVRVDLNNLKEETLQCKNECKQLDEDNDCDLNGTSVEDYGYGSEDDEESFQSKIEAEKELSAQAENKDKLIDDIKSILQDIKQSIDSCDDELDKITDDITTLTTEVIHGCLTTLQNNLSTSYPKPNTLLYYEATPGRLLEIVVALIYKSKGLQVTIMGGAGDRGRDLMVEENILIQCKQGSQIASKGNSIIREVAGTLLLHGVRCGEIWHTNSNFIPTAQMSETLLQYLHQDYKISIHFAGDSLGVMIKKIWKVKEDEIRNLFN